MATANPAGNGERARAGGTERSGRLAEVVSFPSDVLARHNARVLDPAKAVHAKGSVKPETTAYRSDTLLMPLRQVRDDRLLARYNEAIAPLGAELIRVIPDTDLWRRAVQTFDPDFAVPVLITMRDDAVIDEAPDPWTVLNLLRRRFGAELRGVGLEHLAVAAAVEIEGAPFGQGPSVGSAAPFGQGPAMADSGGYALASGARNPVRVFIPEPMRHRPDDLVARRRPVVAVLDTGIGFHPWLRVGTLDQDPVVEVSQEFQALLEQQEVAVASAGGDLLPASLASPFEERDVVQPLLGLTDSHSGHGTFVSGLVFQNCPDARILSLRVLTTDGITTDKSVLLALEWLRRRVQSALDNDCADELVDVVSLSLGFYPERTDHETQLLLAAAVRKLTDLGVVVVAAAGNDATTRPFVPAALALNPDGSNNGNPLLVAVGALNAAGGTIAAFSNEGDWVSRWAPGNAVVSTVPLWQGAGEPPIVLPDPAGGGGKWIRAASDPDDLRTGFAVWAGTSFATPVIAGMIAANLARAKDAPHKGERGARAKWALDTTDELLVKLGWRR